ncbi:DUF4168 domain-containing protein [Stakelama saccharophila]|uniref:DUF4168 domain-containing protein n=1 Tax=Stakelama saccharophila TaxID=3075605 RepID=A0ABZ0B6L8_9SPHN|nr:DUF4168 domain-containing protein [Stakelama sp. W311]WNO52630.1 DUF4168 domain-containing protein [Stakelama sp. W311]
MKTPIFSAFILAGCTLAAPMAQAQDAAPAAPQTITPAKDVSDTEVDAFASTVVDLQGIQQDGSLQPAAKQKKMIAALQSHGLKPARFNAIAKAAQSDKTLQKRVQSAVVAKAEPAK